MVDEGRDVFRKQLACTNNNCRKYLRSQTKRYPEIDNKERKKEMKSNHEDG